MANFRDKLPANGPKKMLALDGGGIRGVLTIEVLAAIETMLREKTKRPGLVLSDWFDYVGGTSTGGIIATCVALGMPMAEVREFYRTSGPAMFVKSGWMDSITHHTYDDTRLR